jgi:hypothetical protein
MATKQNAQLNITPEDLEVVLTGGIVVTGKLRDLILLRQMLQQDSRYKVVYTRNSNMRLYVVNSEEYAVIQKIREGEKKDE